MPRSRAGAGQAVEQRAGQTPAPVVLGDLEGYFGALTAGPYEDAVPDYLPERGLSHQPGAVGIRLVGPVDRPREVRCGGEEAPATRLEGEVVEEGPHRLLVARLHGPHTHDLAVMQDDVVCKGAYRTARGFSTIEAGRWRGIIVSTTCAPGAWACGGTAR